MSRSLTRVALVALACAPLAACFTLTHTVGRGPQSPTPVIATETEWFALWGLVPLEPVDSAVLAGPTPDYRVTTKFTAMDVVITAFSSLLTFYRQTVIVEK